MNSHLSKELIQKYKIRSIRVRKSDKVKIVRGQFKSKTGSVNRVDIKKNKIYIDGCEVIKKDGTKAFYPINPSNIIITELTLDDKKRAKKLKGEKKWNDTLKH